MDQRGIETVLRNTRFELMPFAGFNEDIEHFPAGTIIAITRSRQLGLNRAVEHLCSVKKIGRLERFFVNYRVESPVDRTLMLTDIVLVH